MAVKRRPSDGRKPREILKLDSGSEPMSAAVDPSRCPLCGDANACGMAAGKADCWCMSAKIAPEVLARVPPAARDEVCVCERCAAAAGNERGAATGSSSGEVARRPLRVR